MKHIFLFSILLCAVSLPSFAELTDADLDKIRLIVKDEVEAEVTSSEARMKQYVDLKIGGVEKQITVLTNVVYWLIALIVAAIAIPQLIMALRGRKYSSLEKQVETLTREIETLKEPRIVNP